MQGTREEFLKKVESIRKLAAEKDAQGILITRQTNFAWLSCGGRGFVSLASEGACASLLVTGAGVWLMSNNIETPRLLAEEMPELEGVLQFYAPPWETLGSTNADFIAQKAQGVCLTDMQLAAEFAALRGVLCQEEAERYAELGKEAAQIVEQICRLLKPGMSELETAGLVSSALWARNIEPITLLVAFDRRTELYRHPLPTAQTLQKSALVAVCARRYGLVVSLTRMVSIGAPSDALMQKHRAVVAVDACFMGSTVPGARAGDIFANAVEAYKTTGFADEWRLHHQGGMAGYEAREYIGVFGCDEIVQCGQAFAWNPSITGTKSEDTFLVTDHGCRILTHTGEYPYIEVSYSGGSLLRPDILVLESQ